MTNAAVVFGLALLVCGAAAYQYDHEELAPARRRSSFLQQALGVTTPCGGTGKKSKGVCGAKSPCCCETKKKGVGACSSSCSGTAMAEGHHSTCPGAPAQSAGGGALAVDFTDKTTYNAGIKAVRDATSTDKAPNFHWVEIKGLKGKGVSLYVNLARGATAKSRLYVLAAKHGDAHCVFDGITDTDEKAALDALKGQSFGSLTYPDGTLQMSRAILEKAETTLAGSGSCQDKKDSLDVFAAAVAEAARFKQVREAISNVVASGEVPLNRAIFKNWSKMTGKKFDLDFDVCKWDQGKDAVKDMEASLDTKC